MTEQDVRALDTDQLRKGRVDLIQILWNKLPKDSREYNAKMLYLYETELLSRYAEGLLSE